MPVYHRGQKGPQRIVCLTEETTETLYLLGEQTRIVGISGYTVRPPQARREKPRVSAFTHARIDKILALEPDLVLGFSDMQADIAAQLIRAGVAVHVFNQRSLEGIFAMIHTLGALVGAGAAAERLAESLHRHLDAVRERAATLPRRPRVYFEEWPDPLICGIRWVSELITIAGGEDCFAGLAAGPRGRDRIIADPDEVLRQSPEIVLGSWCGRRFRPDEVKARPGWHILPAVRHQHVYEIPAPLILQPGPAALTDGLDRIHQCIRNWTAMQ